MIGFAIAAAWVLLGVKVYRHIGHWNEANLVDNCSYRSICTSCGCSACGESAWSHHNSRNRCRDGEFIMLKPHTSTWFLIIPSVLFAPMITVWHGFSAVAGRAGGTHAFFTPAPRLKTKHERSEAKAQDFDKRMAELEARNAKLEKDLGIR